MSIAGYVHCLQSSPATRPYSLRWCSTPSGAAGAQHNAKTKPDNRSAAGYDYWRASSLPGVQRSRSTTPAQPVPFPWPERDARIRTSRRGIMVYHRSSIPGCGIPVSHKDTVHTAGARTTQPPGGRLAAQYLPPPGDRPERIGAPGSEKVKLSEAVQPSPSACNRSTAAPCPGGRSCRLQYLSSRQLPGHCIQPPRAVGCGSTTAL
jgi:hypothetical protein